MKSICTVQWISGNLKGIVMKDIPIYGEARVGDIKAPWGCSGSYRVIEVNKITSIT